MYSGVFACTPEYITITPEYMLVLKKHFKAWTILLAVTGFQTRSYWKYADND
jgi:hypothetical protein